MSGMIYKPDKQSLLFRFLWVELGHLGDPQEGLSLSTFKMITDPKINKSIYISSTSQQTKTEA